MEQIITKESKSNKLLLVIGMSTAILLVSPIVGLLIAGYFFDRFFHTAPFFMIMGIIVGSVSGIMNVYRLMQMVQKRKNQKNV